MAGAGIKASDRLTADGERRMADAGWRLSHTGPRSQRTFKTLVIWFRHNSKVILFPAIGTKALLFNCAS